MHQEILFPHEKTALYPLLAQQIAALAEDSQPLSTLANASALLYEALPDINWAGFDLASGDMLHLGPFQGRTACTQIPFGRGVCGTAAATRPCCASCRRWGIGWRRSMQTGSTRIT